MLERRLAMQESTVGKPSLTKITDRFRDYLALAKGANGASKADSPKNKLLLQDVFREVEQYELECSKMYRQHAAATEEAAHYKALGDGFEEQIGDMEKELRDLAKQLEENKALRRHRKLIDEYAAEVRLLPSRGALSAKNSEVQGALQNVVRSIADMESKINTRKQQFKQLQEAVQALMQPLASEAEAEAEAEGEEGDMELEEGRGGRSERRGGADEPEEEAVEEDEEEGEEVNGYTGGEADGDFMIS